MNMLKMEKHVHILDILKKNIKGYSICFKGGKSKLRKIPVPSHRYTPLKENWMKIFSPVVDHLNLQIRFNLKSRNVELKVSIVEFDFIKAIFYYCKIVTIISPARLNNHIL